MSTNAAFGTQLIGQTEKALNAILARHLAGTGVTEPQWVALTIVVMGAGTVQKDQLVARMCGALKMSEADAEALVGELVDGHLLADDEDASEVRVTEAGARLHGRIRASVVEITGRLWGDLPSDDLQTAARVLATVLARANDELDVGP